MKATSKKKKANGRRSPIRSVRSNREQELFRAAGAERLSNPETLLDAKGNLGTLEGETSGRARKFLKASG